MQLMCGLHHVLGEINAEILRGASVAQSSEQGPFTSEKVHQSRRFSPDAPVSSHRES
jgi:hypothetical protein